jgi:hypothetical protein
VVTKVRAVWAAILKTEVAADTDFFAAGAGSMDVVRFAGETCGQMLPPPPPGLVVTCGGKVRKRV